MRALLIIFLFGFINNVCYSQTDASIFDVRNVYDEKGDYYFEKNNFKKAIVYYNMAYKKDANNYYSVLKKAEAYAKLELYDHAAECYRAIFDTELRIPNEHRLDFAFLLLKNKDIKGFEEWLGKYNEIVNVETSDVFYLSNAEVRAKMYKDSSFIIVENESVINTPASEISPSIYNDKVIFASTRRKMDGSTANSYYNVFSANYLDNGKLGKINKFNKSFNSKLNESALFISDKTKRLYFTRSTDLYSGLKTYFADIPNDINDAPGTDEIQIEGFGSIGHLSFNSDGTKMFFVSDDPGGTGGLDIYSSNFINGKWAKPTNLGKRINTSSDEMYPFVLNDSILYFTSAGHKGHGGLDLFSVNLNQENGSVVNLGNKVNSKYDDYSLSFSPGGLTGYFCSNRPGGIGEEDIYRAHILNIKVKYAAYRFKKKYFMEEDKINLYLSDGEEYNIASDKIKGFNFDFKPEENYKMVVQHENVLVNNIINNRELSDKQRRKKFLSPPPVEKTDIKLQAGMKYNFTAGMNPISEVYKNALKEMSEGYQNQSSTIDLTALAKELLLREGEIYTIQFVKDDSRPSDYKSKELTSLSINDKAVDIKGRSFFIVLPLDIEVNFNIKTDIEHFKETFNPKKVGTVNIDETPVIKEKKVVKETEGFPILVNTESLGDIVPAAKINAKELTIIPGSMYILTLGMDDPKASKDQEVVVPLTKGVKYNLGADAEEQTEYNKAITQLTSGQAGMSDDEELIDISVLSKVLDMTSEDNIVFNLMPAVKIATQKADSRNVLTTLDVDGRKYFITDRQKLLVKLKLDQTKKVNIQTDLTYVKENFDPTTIAVKVDTVSFNKEIITDPVFDVVVVNFDLNKYAIRPDAKSILENKVINELKADSRLYVTIKGYTDALGDAAYNEKLSRNRAISVKDFLAGNGIGESRIRTFSFGESLSLEEGVNWEDLNEKELQKHRKVEIVIYLPK